MVSFGFFVSCHIKLPGLFHAKLIIVDEQQRYSLICSWRDKRIHAFPKGIRPKVNVTARQEIELTYFKAVATRKLSTSLKGGKKNTRENQKSCTSFSEDHICKNRTIIQCLWLLIYIYIYKSLSLSLSLWIYIYIYIYIHIYTYILPSIWLNNNTST